VVHGTSLVVSGTSLMVHGTSLVVSGTSLVVRETSLVVSGTSLVVRESNLSDGIYDNILCDAPKIFTESSTVN